MKSGRDETTITDEMRKKQRSSERGPPPRCKRGDDAYADDTEPAPAVETFTAAALMKMELPEPHYAVDGIVQEGFNILAGKPKLGKSWMALLIALAIATGGCAFGSIAVEQGDVLYLALEDTKRRLKDRIDKLLRKQNAQAPERLTLATEWPRQDKSGLAAIERWVTAQKRPRLIVVDTWPKFRPRSLVRANEYETDYAYAGEFKDVADRAGVPVLAVAHCRKMGAPDPVEEIMGTMGLSGAADGLLVLRRQRGQADATLCITGRDVEERELAMKWDAEFAQWSIEGDAEACRMSKERAEVLDLLRRADRPMKPAEVTAVLGKPSGTVKSMLYRMSVDGLLKSANGAYYAPKDNRGNQATPATVQPVQPRNRKGGSVAALDKGCNREENPADVAKRLFSK